ncbi:SDR family NAD(P)-dependent oxidoreductase [Rhodococcus sp. ACT016]|uniref:SDR family NAD(P)-dependent oxidoreductase n=1 Tax=Rhodococcus sp. ACT016 TaxID=3134808 RepID=UPI003D2786AF
MSENAFGDGAVIITGSSRGIGRAVAHTLSAEGVPVVVNGRDREVVDATVGEIVSRGGEAVGVPGSAADTGVAQMLLDAGLESFGDVGALICCAGIAEPAGSSILDVADDDWEELIDAHLTSTFRACRVVAPHLVDRAAGAIVNTSSYAYLGCYGGTGYAAAKGAVNSLTLAMAAELAEFGVRANVVAPGARTRLSSGDGYLEQIETLHRRGLLSDAMYQGSLDPAPAEYVARLYAYLVSDSSRGVTGRIFAGSGCFLGEFEYTHPSVLAWRDHATEEPWRIDEIARFVTGPE